MNEQEVFRADYLELTREDLAIEERQSLLAVHDLINKRCDDCERDVAAMRRWTSDRLGAGWKPAVSAAVDGSIGL